jgi:mediator of RNA polymerase II transcription subunit 18
MHELLLYGQLPAARHGQLLNVLAGLSAMQPKRIIERHVLFKPTRGPVQLDIVRGAGAGTQAQTQAKKKQQQQVQQTGELYHTHLVKDLEEEDFGRVVNGDQPMDLDGSDEDEEQRAWRLRFEDVPEGGKRTAILRMVENTDLPEGDTQAYMEGLGYRYKIFYDLVFLCLYLHRYLSEYIVDGHRFVHNNVVLYLHRVLQLPSQHDTTSINTPLPPSSTLVPLDPSGGYLLQAMVRLSDGTNPKIVNLGLEALDAFRLRMKGVIDMRMPERLALDTRVK